MTRDEARLSTHIVSVLPGRVRHDSKTLVQARAEVEPLMTPEYLRDASFQWIDVYVVYALHTELRPRISGRDRPNLEITVELEMAALKRLSRYDLLRTFRYVLLNTLVRVADHYGLPAAEVRSQRDAGALLPDGTAVVASLRPRSDGPPAVLPLKKSTTVDLQVQYAIDGFGSGEDLRKRHAIEAILDQQLRATRTGVCTGGSTGSGTMNIYCEARDGERACRTIQRALGEAGYLEGATITGDTSDGTQVIYRRSGD